MYFLMYLVLYLSMRLFSCLLMSLSLYFLMPKHLFVSLSHNIFRLKNRLERNEALMSGVNLWKAAA